MASSLGEGYNQGLQSGLNQAKLLDFNLDQLGDQALGRTFQALGQAPQGMPGPVPGMGQPPGPGGVPMPPGAGAPPQQQPMPSQGPPPQQPLGMGAPPGSQMANMGERWPAVSSAMPPSQGMTQAPQPRPQYGPPMSAMAQQPQQPPQQPPQGPPQGGGGMPQPQGQYDIATAAQAIARANPNIRPEVLVHALVRAAPWLNQEGKMQVAQMKMDMQAQLAEQKYESARDIANIRAGAQETVAGIGAQSREAVAQTQVTGRENVAQIMADAKKYGIDTNRDIASVKADIEREKEQGRTDRATQAEEGKTTRTEMTEGGKTERAQLSADTKTSIAKLSAETREEIAKAAEEGKDYRTGLSLDARKELATLNNDARMEIQKFLEPGRTQRTTIAEQGKTARAELSASTKAEIASLNNEARQELQTYLEAGRETRSARTQSTAERGQDIRAGTAAAAEAGKGQRAELSANTRKAIEGMSEQARKELQTYLEAGREERSMRTQSTAERGQDVRAGTAAAAELGKTERARVTTELAKQRIDISKEKLENYKRVGQERHEDALARLAQGDERIKASIEAKGKALTLAQKRAQIDASHKRFQEIVSIYSMMNELPPKDKAALRKQVEDAYLEEIKNLAKTPPPPKPGDIQDNHKFKGGDPKDPKNWEPLGATLEGKPMPGVGGGLHG